MQITDKEVILTSGTRLSHKLFVEKISSNIFLESFIALKITVDRSIRVGALRSTLDPIITDLSNNDDLDDNSRNKVNNYDLLSEFGLETLLFLQKNKDLEDRYLINLYANIFKYFESNKIAFPGFEQILMAEVVRDNDPIIVNARLNRVFDDIDNEIDGISVKLARKIFYNTLTDNEILYLGDKYRVSIPERLTKRDLINEIVKQPSGENPEQLKLKLMRMSISMLESYVSQNHLNINIITTKAERIEYLLYNNLYRHYYYEKLKGKEEYSLNYNPPGIEAIPAPTYTKPSIPPSKPSVAKKADVISLAPTEDLSAEETEKLEQKLKEKSNTPAILPEEMSAPNAVGSSDHFSIKNKEQSKKRTFINNNKQVGSIVRIDDELPSVKDEIDDSDPYTINIFGTILEKEEFLEKIKTVADIGSMFKSFDVRIYRYVRVNVLRSIITEMVERINFKAGTSNKIRQRRFFNVYSELGLQALFFSYKSAEFEEIYIFDLFKKIFKFMREHQMNYSFFTKVISQNQSKPLVTVQEIDTSLNQIFGDFRTEFDCIPYDLLRPILYNSFNLEGLIDLGRKYGIKLSTKFKKADIVKKIVEQSTYLKEEQLKDLDGYLNGQPLAVVIKYIEERDLDVETEVDEKQLIEMILKAIPVYNLNYEPPVDETAYDLVFEADLKYDSEIRSIELEGNTKYELATNTNFSEIQAPNDFSRKYNFKQLIMVNKKTVQKKIAKSNLIAIIAIGVGVILLGIIIFLIVTK